MELCVVSVIFLCLLIIFRYSLISFSHLSESFAFRVSSSFPVKSAYFTLVASLRSSRCEILNWLLNLQKGEI